MKPIYSYQFQDFVYEIYNQKPIHLNLKTITQTHSSIIQNIYEDRPQADGISFNKDDLSEYIPAIKTADCLPIWLVSQEQQFLIHAGWRGLTDGIIQKALNKLNTSLAFSLIGPSISDECFEVKDDFRQHFLNSKNFQQINKKLTFNLQEEAKMIIDRHQAQARNKPKDEIAKLCTYQHPQLHSFRQNGTALRNWSIVRKS